VSGIILIFILGVWFVVVIKLTGLATSWMESGKGKYLAYVVMFVLLFLAPVADDIAGGFQFRALCKEGGAPIYVRGIVQGRTVKYSSSGWNELNGTIVPIQELTIYWVDATSGKELLTYKKYDADGGWLSRLIGFPEGSPPYTFKATCGNENTSIGDRLRFIIN